MNFLTVWTFGEVLTSASLNSLINLFNGTAPAKMRWGGNADGEVWHQPTSSDPADTTTVQTGGKLFGDSSSTWRWYCSYAGKVYARTLEIVGASTLTGAVTASDTLAVTGVSTFTGAIDANSTGTNTVAGTVRLGDNLANYDEFAGAATGNRPTVKFTGSDADVSGEIQSKAAGTVRITSSTLANGVVITPVATGSAPSIRTVGDANRNLIVDGVGTGKATDASGNRYMSIGADLPSGTVMLAFQAAAPTGWTQLTAQNDKLLRVVSGAGGGAAGTTAFTSCWVATTTGNESTHTHGVGAHTHTQNKSGATTVGAVAGLSILDSDGLSLYTGTGGAASTTMQAGVQSSNGTTAAGDAHNHSVTAYVPQYIDIITISKSA